MLQFRPIMLLKHTNYAPNISNYAHEKVKLFYVTNHAILVGNSYFLAKSRE